jgi:hypothetical protein
MGSIVDRDGNVMTTYMHDEMSDTLTIKTSADVEANIEANKREYLDNQHSRFGDMKRVASIPVVVMEKWIAEDGINYMAPEHMNALRRKLNDPDNKFLRTMPGKL